MGHDSDHRQYTGGISPLGGPPADRQPTEEECGQELVVTLYGCGDIGGRTIGGGDLCHLMPEHGQTLHHEPYDNITISGNTAAPWGKSVQDVVGTVDDNYRVINLFSPW